MILLNLTVCVRHSAPLRTKKDFPPMYASIPRWKIFLVLLTLDKLGPNVSPLPVVILVQYHRCVIHVCELCDGGIVLVTRASY